MITRTHNDTDCDAIRERAKLRTVELSLRKQITAELLKSPHLKRSWHIYANKPVVEHALRYPEIGVVSPLPMIEDDI